jgi:hypothetical protein
VSIPPPSPSAAPAAHSWPPVSTGDWVAAVLVSVLLPMIGAVLGLYYAVQGRGRRRVGVGMMALSAVATVVYLVLFGGSSSG